MKLKLDENLGQRGAAVLRHAGHDVDTVVDEGLTSAPDADLIAVCQTEGRCLVTMDLDFANPLRFDPALYSGIAVLRVGGPVSVPAIDQLMATLATALGARTIDGRLWIVEPDRIREYSPESE